MRKTYQPLPLSAAVLSRVDRVAHGLYGGPADTRATADAVSAVSQVYTRERATMASLDSALTGGSKRFDKRALLARAGFFWPRDLPKVFGPLDALQTWNLAPQRETLRVLDVGAGLGATSFGLARWLRVRGLPVQQLRVTALEQSESALRGFGAFVRALADLPDELVPIELTARAEDLRTMRTSDKFDLVLFGFVLNELFLDQPEVERTQRRAELLCQASERLAPAGAIIVLEPALKPTTRELMHLRDVLVARAAAPFVVAPCLHTRACPMLPSERDWCHQELPYALPPKLAEVARAAQLRYEGLRYASLVLRNSERPHDQDEHLYRIVSDRLASKGKLELLACGTPRYQKFTRLERHESAENEAFGAAERGALLEIEGDGARIEAETKVRAR